MIIVGSGPAGALMGYDLSQYGLKVLLVEKESLPRYKACGGGLTRRTLDALPFDVSPVIEDYTYTARMLYRNRLLYVKTHDKPIVGMVMRDDFDYFLIEQAMAKGLVVHDDTAFESVSGRAGELLIKTSKGSYKAKVVAGADGVNSSVAKALDLKIKHDVMMAIEGEVCPEDMGMLEKFRNSIDLDFGVIPGGYGWVFPKKDHLSIGVGSSIRGLRDWKGYFRSYLELKGIIPESMKYPVRGRLIPINPHKGNILSNERGLVAGDAAGFTDPMTGEGIFYAVRQAAIASQVIKDVFLSGSSVAEYTGLVKREFMNDLIWAKRMAHVLYRYPAISRRLLFRCGEALGENQTAVILSQQTYSDVFRKIAILMLNPIRLLSLLSQND
ncbi:MAG: geranylgeranyl reductase family protein [Deltaproteobacteria bacterium]|nr:geranylgeranyl reductase family protein [Deltaproteobacteria bacterium]